MTELDQTTVTHSAIRQAVPRIATFLTTNPFVRPLLGLSIIVAFALVSRPTLPVAVILFCTAAIYIFVYRHDAPFRATLETAFRSSALCIGLFLAAALAAVPTAFNAANHLATVPKIIALQVMVVLFYCVGRFVGDVNVRSLMWWSFGIAGLSTVLVIEEQHWKFLRAFFASADLLDFGDATVLNRAFLILSLALTFFLIAGTQLRLWAMTVLALILMAAAFAVTQSESARLIILLGLVLVCVKRHHLNIVLTFAVIGSIAIMVVGPFFYETALKLWDAGPLADFKTQTFHDRFEIWAEFSALIRDSNYLGRGLNSSKLIVADPSLFTMPYRPCDADRQVVGYYCAWHPHNAGLEVTADLGFLGIIWFSTVLWKIRNLVATCPSSSSERGLIVIAIGFLVISFVADGLWQSWWWFAAAILALWIGILSDNRDEMESAAI